MQDDGSGGDGAPDEAELVADLFAWARESGALGLEQLRVARFEKRGAPVRGLAAAEVVGPVVLPRSLLMTADSVDQLALQLAREEQGMRSGGQSFWSPWIRLVPTRAELQREHLAYACAELLEGFAELPVVARVHEWERRLRETWEGVDKQGLTFDDFRWASTIALSRVYLPPPTHCFMPFADMMNTGGEPNMEVYDYLEVGDTSEAKHYGLMLLPGATIPPGKELLQSYDGVDNAERLFRGGFLLEDNPRPLPPLEGAGARAALEAAAARCFPEAEACQPRLLASLRALASEHCAASA